MNLCHASMRALRNVLYEIGLVARHSAGWGRIINIGSCLGEAVPLPGVTMYVATKFAVQGFTRALSRELGSSGVTVNNVQPGAIDTELSPDDNGPAAQMMKKIMNVGRFGRVEEIASGVAFLANLESAFINGDSLTVDGGWNASGRVRCASADPEVFYAADTLPVG